MYMYELTVEISTPAESKTTEIIIGSSVGGVSLLLIVTIVIVAIIICVLRERAVK